MGLTYRPWWPWRSLSQLCRDFRRLTICHHNSWGAQSVLSCTTERKQTDGQTLSRQNKLLGTSLVRVALTDIHVIGQRARLLRKELWEFPNILPALVWEPLTGFFCSLAGIHGLYTHLFLIRSSDTLDKELELLLRYSLLKGTIKGKEQLVSVTGYKKNRCIFRNYRVFVLYLCSHS